MKFLSEEELLELSSGQIVYFEEDSITPLKIYNGTPEGCLTRDSRATLPINELYQAPIKDGSASEACNLAAPMGLLRRPDSNLHRCNNDSKINFFNPGYSSSRSWVRAHGSPIPNNRTGPP